LPIEKRVGFTNLDLPVRKTDSNFEVLVNNVMQDNEINRLLTDAVQFIRKQLSNANISIATKIAEESEIQRSLTPEQRYNEMVAKNPQLEQFRKMLSLEID
jgi:DNA polymerase-3 subunit gamma/tau